MEILELNTGAVEFPLPKKVGLKAREEVFVTLGVTEGCQVIVAAREQITYERAKRSNAGRTFKLAALLEP